MLTKHPNFNFRIMPRSLTILRFGLFSTVIAVSVILLVSPLSRSHASDSDLLAIYQLALENDAAYQIAKLTHDSNSVDLPLAKTAFKPSLSISGVMGRNRSNDRQITTTEPGNRIGMDLNLKLYDRNAKMGIEQTSLEEQVSALKLADAKNDLMLRVANRYFSLLASLDERKVARVQSTAIHRQMDLANERLEVGLGTRSDLFDAKARFQQAQADEIRTENLINNNIAILKEMIGVDPGEIMPLADNAPLELPFPNDVDQWIGQALEKNLEIKIQASNVETSKIEITKALTTKTPTVGLRASHFWSEIGSAGISNDTSRTALELNFSVPIYSGGAIDLKTEKAMIQHKLSEQLFEHTKRRISTATISEFLAVNSRLNQANALLEAIVAGENALAAKEEGFSAGLTTNIDVLDAQRDLSRSRKDYLQARYDYILSTLNLERVTGQLDEDDISRVNNWLRLSGSSAMKMKIQPAFVDSIPELLMESYAMNIINTGAVTTPHPG